MASTRRRTELAADDEPGLTRKRRCELLGVARTSTYYEPAVPKPAGPEELEGVEARMAVIDEVYCEMPATGTRKMARECTRRGLETTRHQAQRLMERMNLRCVYPKPRTSDPAKGHPKFPYLLRGMRIWLPNLVVS